MPKKRKLALALALSACQVGAEAVRPDSSGEISGRRMAWAHYVPWFKPENASLAADRFYNFPLTTVDECESRHVSTRREIELALSNGIDGWLVDLGANPPNGRFNSSSDLLGYLNAATGTPFMVAICLDGGGSADYVAREVVRMLKECAPHPNYPKMNGRPILSTYSYLRILPERSEMMRLVRQAGFDPYLIANANPWPGKPTDFAKLQPHLDAFDAVYMFDAPGHAKDPPEVTNGELRDWCAKHGKLDVPSLHPGYLGGWLSGHNDYYHPFRGMDMLFRMYKSARAAATADWVHVTTWNDLVETALMPCVFTPGTVRLVKAYCEDLKGRDVASKSVRINFAYHREELVGTMLRIEAMLLPRTADGDVSVDGLLLGRDGRTVGRLETRHLAGKGFVRCEWLVPTVTLSAHPSITPCICVAPGDASPRTALLPSINLVTGWIQNQVTVNVAFDEMLADCRPALSVSQANDVLTASLDVGKTEPLKRAVLFRNDRPFAVFRRGFGDGEYERVIRMDGVDSELSMSVANGRILRAVKNYERNGCRWWQWNVSNLVTRSCPAWSLHALVVSGGRDLKLSVNAKTAPRMDYDGPDLTVMNSPPIGPVDGLLAARRQSSLPRMTDSFWALVEAESGKLHYTPVIHPFDADRRLVERAILETATSLETTCGLSGHALRGESEFLTPAERLPVVSNRVVRCKVPLAGSRHAEWNLSSHKGVFELPRRVWPQGTQRLRLTVRPAAGKPVRQTLVFKQGWSDGVTLDLVADGRVELSRHFRTGQQQTVFDRAIGSQPLEPDRWHELVVEGDMDAIRLFVDGKLDARLKPTPVRCMEQCRIFVGGAQGREPFRGKLGLLSIDGL